MDTRTSQSGDLDTKALLRQWAERLGSTTRALSSLLVGSEEEFLSVGRSLEGIAGRANALMERSALAAGLLSEGQMGRSVEALCLEVDGLSAHLADTARASHESLRRLSDTEELLHGVEGFRDQFVRIVKRLQALGVCTRIESARLGSAAAGFQTIANDVQGLADLVQTKLTTVLGHANAIRPLVLQVSEQTREVSENERTAAAVLLAEARSALDAVARLNAGACEAAARIAEKTSTVSRVVGEVAVSLQFHDITRQQLEHVVEALEGLCQEIAGGSAAPEQMAEKARDLCELQTHQLELTRSELVGAVTRMIDGLHGISLDVAAVSEQSREISGSGDGSGGSLLARVEDRLGAVARSLRDAAERGAEIAGVMGSVADTVGTMASSVKDIEQIGADVELIAINATISAAHAGASGVTLSVLAQEIQKVAGEAQRQTGVATDYLMKIAVQAQELKTDSSASLGEGASDARRVVTDLEATLRQLRDIDRRFGEALQGVEAGSQTLEAEIRQVLSGVSIHSRADQVIRVAAAELASIAATGGGSGRGADRAERARRLAAEEARYTMESERRILRSVAASESGPRPGPSLAPAGQTGGLGSNVELF